MTLQDLLVPGRNCDECTVCCTSLRIEEPELMKKADVPCPHLSCERGCSIYNERPGVCRTWYCGWRILPFLKADMRPDRAGVLIRTDASNYTFQPVSREDASKLLEMNVMNAIASLVANDFNVYLSVPTRPGFTNALMPLNAALKPSLKSMDFEEGVSAVKNVIFVGSRSLTLEESD